VIRAFPTFVSYEAWSYVRPAPPVHSIKASDKPDTTPVIQVRFIEPS
jgi:hypothetical protein